MSLGSLGTLYLLVGTGVAFAVYARAHGPRARRVASAVLAVPLWPLWAPIAVAAGERRPPRGSAGSSRAIARIEDALREAVLAAKGSPLEALVPAHAVERIRQEVARVAEREAELAELLEEPSFDLGHAEARVASLEASGADARALASARVHLENVRRVALLRARDLRSLDELADLVEVLRTQLVLSRYAGSSAHGIGGIVGEVWARVEGLGEAIDHAD